MTACPFCGKPVDPTARQVWQRVSGWEQRRVQGGTNAIALRHVEQEWAHQLCIERAKNGRTGQGSLL